MDRNGHQGSSQGGVRYAARGSLPLQFLILTVCGRVTGGTVGAAGFFTVEALTRTGVVRFLAFFVRDLKSRRVKIAGIAPDPDGRWTKQIARNPTDVEDGFLVGTRHLIHDRDPRFTTEFRKIVRSGGPRDVGWILAHYEILQKIIGQS